MIEKVCEEKNSMELCEECIHCVVDIPTNDIDCDIGLEPEESEEESGSWRCDRFKDYSIFAEDEK